MDWVFTWIPVVVVVVVEGVVVRIVGGKPVLRICDELLQDSDRLNLVAVFGIAEAI